jgi:hypothetical protein
MRFFRGGRQEERSEPEDSGVKALKELWGIGEEKPAYEPVTTPVSSDIYNVPSVLRVIPRSSRSRH